MDTFLEMGLAPELLRAVEELGFTTPTPVQLKTIPIILNSANDLVVLAQTGTGKTAAFGLPVLQLSDMKSQSLQTLVLCPTRELCMQITADFVKYSKFIPGFRVVPVYGGTNILTQIRAVKDNPQVIIGTPGRVMDLIRRKILKLSGIRWVVLDEADEMLNMGFSEDLDSILAETPKERQTLLFSATMPKGIAEIAGKYMNSPEEVSLGKRNAGAENVKHEYYMVHAKDRYLALKRIVDMNPSIYGIVFCRTRIETKEVADKLMQDGYNADALHGDLSQVQRDYVMNKFRIKNLQLLVATDVAARGLDVQELTHIINYNLPDDPEIYVHRSGRTGRAGNSGVSVSIIHTRELNRIKDLERMARKTFERKMVPGGKEICEKQLFKLVDTVENTVVDNEIEKYLPVIYKKLEWLSREELIKHFISVEFNRFLEYYKDAPDLNSYRSEKTERPDRSERSERSDRSERFERSRQSDPAAFTRLHINIGNKHELNAGSLIAWVNRHSRGKRIGIGKIEILRNFSFFEVDSESATQVVKDLEGTSFDGNPVSIETSSPSSSAPEYRRNDSSRTSDFRRNDSSSRAPEYRRHDTSTYTRSSKRKRN
jgi:ATP-dependent RNA helicase DeaD